MLPVWQVGLALLASMLITCAIGAWLAWEHARPKWRCPVDLEPMHTNHRPVLVLCRDGSVCMARYFRIRSSAGERCFWVQVSNGNRIPAEQVWGWFDVEQVSTDALALEE